MSEVAARVNGPQLATQVDNSDAMTCAEQLQLDALYEIQGKTGSHSSLAAEVEELGFVVRMNKDNNRCSRIFLRGCWSPIGTETIVGQILGEEESRLELFCDSNRGGRARGISQPGQQKERHTNEYATGPEHA